MSKFKNGDIIRIQDHPSSHHFVIVDGEMYTLYPLSFTSMEGPFLVFQSNIDVSDELVTSILREENE